MLKCLAIVVLLGALSPQSDAAPSAKGLSSCAEGAAAFPFLKPWAGRLENFATPIEIGSTEGSLLYSVGATVVGKRAAEAWRADSYRLPIEFKGKTGNLESAWLGGLGPASVGVAETGGWPKAWGQLLAAKELELLERCSVDNCKIKLNESELEAISGARVSARPGRFRQLIEKRLDEYRKQGKVWGYEGTLGPMEWQRVPLSPIFPRELATHFWVPRDRASFAYEVLDAEPGRHKPVVGLFSRQCERRGEGKKAYTACTDVGLYNNHYFDFWARLVFFFPWCDSHIALVYESMDIDQIKENKVVRILFGSEMRKLLGQVLETRLKRLHMLGY